MCLRRKDECRHFEWLCKVVTVNSRQVVLVDGQQVTVQVVLALELPFTPKHKAAKWVLLYYVQTMGSQILNCRETQVFTLIRQVQTLEFLSHITPGGDECAVLPAKSQGAAYLDGVKGASVMLGKLAYNLLL